MCANGFRLGDVAAFENRQTEPKPNRITNDEDKYKSSIVKVQPGLLPNSEQKVEPIFGAQPYCQTECYLLAINRQFLKILLSY